MGTKKKFSLQLYFFFAFCFLVSFTEALKELRIVPVSKAKLQTTIAANFPFDPKLEVEIVESNQRITSGDDSSLTVTALLSGSSCLSLDSSFQLSNGVGVFPGSICEVADDVTLSFQVTVNNQVTTSDSTDPFNVTGDIQIAYIHKDRYGYDGQLEQFIIDQVEDINNGWYLDPFRTLFPGRTVKLQTYHYPSNFPDEALKAYNKMRAHHMAHPEQKSFAVIGFGSNDVSKLLLPLTVMDGYSVVSYRYDSLSEFSDKDKYPNFNRIVYSDGMVDYGFLVYLKERKWNRILIINGQDSKFTAEFYAYAKQLGIEIIKEFMIASVADSEVEPVGKLDAMFQSIKHSGIKLIVTNAKGPTGQYLYTEAVRANVTCTDHYQWVGYRNEEDFPYQNIPLGCHRSESELCVLRFKGMTFVNPIYLVQGYDTRQWDYVWNRHWYGDEEKALSKSRAYPRYDMTGEGATYGLARDSVTTNMLAIERLIKANKTISGESLALEIRSNTNFNGLSGDVVLDSATGNRLNFIAGATVNYPNINHFNTKHGAKIAAGTWNWWEWETYTKSLTTNTIFFVKDTQTTSVVEYKTNGGKNSMTIRTTYNDFEVLNAYIDLPPEAYNNRTYKAYKGMFHFDKQKQVVDNWDRYTEDVFIPLEEETRTELVPAVYYCSNGCGGKILDAGDILKFENGECVKQDTCKCLTDPTTKLELWKGATCSVAVCKAGCDKGECVSPDNCVCALGYTGVDCSQPICSSCSSGGVCIAPGNCQCNSNRYGPGCESWCTCSMGECNGGASGDGFCTKCDSGYIGANCDISLVALCVPTVIGIIVFGISLYLLVTMFIKRTKLKAALFNNDWIVNWSDLKRHDEATGRSSMFLSAMSMNDNSRQRKQINTGTWDGIDVHYQKLEKNSVVLSQSVRLEVKQMRDMRHINVAQFIGCCVEAPNVCVLTELQPKGSLDDILMNEDIKLPWDFRFALLKGICTGLEYLHRSEIKSHGRLKSSNCLIDSRWTVKLTGFGLHEFKSGQKGVGEFKPHSGQNIDHSQANFGSLLWTAPELLRSGAYHLDHIGRGTVEGDVYSMGMLMSEMCTRDVPFAEVVLEKSELISLILGSKDEVVLKVWNDYLAKLNVEQGGWTRPCVKDNEWPSKYEKRKALKKLMESAWHEDAVHRPTIPEIKKELERIDPQRGELMDHLVTMLEKYSSNLEDMVAKRTKQLQKEKQKTEDLVSRLLPKSVADDLKQGKRVEPVNYEWVTIYFSDIVGFTSIAKASTPLEVVALLNDMYTKFDSISANYDVYKVETIGDAYMIVSGLPTKNGDKHAGEICSTAMDLMCAIGDFVIAHMPDTKLRLRAGIHTGNVVAGVVGLKMPRYCLFGESVNVASKMESGGKPLRIHISEDTYKILCRLGGYHCEYRHEEDVKGRGLIKTYWLTGKDGYTKQLPVPSEED